MCVAKMRRNARILSAFLATWILGIVYYMYHAGENAVSRYVAVSFAELLCRRLLICNGSCSAVAVTVATSRSSTTYVYKLRHVYSVNTTS